MAAADAGAGQGAGASILNAIDQISYSGKLEAKNFRSLKATGISVDDVYSVLARQMGKSIDETKKLNDQGKITADQAVEAILGAADTKFKGVLEKKVGGVGAMFTAMADMPKQMMMRATVQSYVTRMFDDGVNFARGVAEGISSGVVNVVASVLALGQNAIDTLVSKGSRKP